MRRYYRDNPEQYAKRLTRQREYYRETVKAEVAKRRQKLADDKKKFLDSFEDVVLVFTLKGDS
jgi:hypothetical protein